MHDYILVVVVKLLAYLKPSFVLSWVLWRWIVVYLHECLSTCYLGWELLFIWLRTILLVGGCGFSCLLEQLVLVLVATCHECGLLTTFKLFTIFVYRVTCLLVQCFILFVLVV